MSLALKKSNQNVIRRKSLKELQSKEQLRAIFAAFGRNFLESARWQKYVLPEDNRLPAVAEAAMAEMGGGDGEGGRVGEDGMLEELVEESRSVLSR